MHRLMGRHGLSAGPFVTTLMLLLAPGAGMAAAAADAENAPDRSIVVQGTALAAEAGAAAGQDPAPEPETPAASEPDKAGGDFLSQLEVSGLVDGYYAWAFHEESPGLRSFDINHNQFSLSYAELAISKPVSDTSRAGFRLDFGAGDTADVVNSFEPGDPDFMKHVQQAYVSYLIPAGKGITFDFGKFVTPHGAEVIEAPANFNYSRGILFGWAIPFYHMGARFSYPTTDKVTLTGYLVNGWNNVHDNNSAKTVGGTVAVTATDRISFAQSYMVGAEQENNSDDVRHLFDTLLTYKATPQATVLVNFDYARDKVEGADIDWYGVAAYLNYKLDDNWAVTPRYEIFKDSDGFATGLAQTAQSFTLTAEYKISDLITRYEFRTDFSDEPFFANGDQLEKSQSALIFGIIYTFSNK
jgi:hypothetical protein